MFYFYFVVFMLQALLTSGVKQDETLLTSGKHPHKNKTVSFSPQLIAEDGHRASTTSKSRMSKIKSILKSGEQHPQDSTDITG